MEHRPLPGSPHIFDPRPAPRCCPAQAASAGETDVAALEARLKAATATVVRKDILLRELRAQMDKVSGG